VSVLEEENIFGLVLCEFPKGVDIKLNEQKLKQNFYLQLIIIPETQWFKIVVFQQLCSRVCGEIL
jgi:hypothetical protein